MIYFSNAVRGSGLQARTVKQTARKLMEAVDEGESTLSLSFVDDVAIRAMNKEHRGKDAPTDVLSFPLWQPEEARAEHVERMLGDIVISIDTARRQAAEYDATLAQEVGRLLIHGLLHLLGHDHEEAEEARRMRTEEQRLAACIGLPWPYHD